MAEGKIPALTCSRLSVPEPCRDSSEPAAWAVERLGGIGTERVTYRWEKTFAFKWLDMLIPFTPVGRRWPLTSIENARCTGVKGISICLDSRACRGFLKLAWVPLGAVGCW